MRLFWVVFRKETKELFRDFRSVIVSLLVPVVLFPLVFGVMSANLRSQPEPTEEPVLLSVHTAVDAGLRDALDEIPELRVVASEDPRGLVEAGAAEVGLDWEPEDPGEVYDPLYPRLSLLVVPEDPRSALGAELAAGVVEGVTSSLRQNYLSSVEVPGIDPRLAEPVTLSRRPVTDPAAQAGLSFLAFLIPLLLIVATCISPLPSAADLAAGEKERGTLSTLLVTPTPNGALVGGKLAAVSLMGILGTIAFGVGVLISLQISRDLLGIDEMLFPLSLGQALGITTFGVGLAICFSAIELLLSLLAKSPKEAQVFFVPLLILSTAAGYGTFLMDLSRLAPWMPHLPILNVGLAVKQVILGEGEASISIIAALWMLAYLFGALGAALRLIRNEKVALRI